MQRAPNASQRDVAEHVGLSHNACWRRMKRLEEAGVLLGRVARVDRRRLGLELVVFTLIRTRHHSRGWLASFAERVRSIPEVIDFFRVAGEFDYLLKIVARNMVDFDRVYQQLIAEHDLENVSSIISMEAIVEERPLPVHPVDGPT